MRAQDLLAESILASKTLAARYLVGFDDATRTSQPPGLPNHLAWSLGHLAFTMHRVAERLDGRPIPESDFAKGSSDPGRFDAESLGFGSKPVDDRSKYPPLARCVEVFNSACDRLAAAARAASDAKLDEIVPWGQGQIPLWAMVQRMVFHNGVHTGQIADTRRALGFKSIFS